MMILAIVLIVLWAVCQGLAIYAKIRAKNADEKEMSENPNKSTF